MKRILILAGIAVVAIVGFRLSGSRDDGAPLATQSPAITTYTVAVLTPGVSLRNGGTDEFKTISDQVTVSAGNEIRTDEAGRAKLLYPNGTITTIEPDSHLVIETLAADGDQSRLTLVVGSIWSKVQNILGTNDYYEIETENAVASVRGTIFRTEFRNRRSRIIGIEGKLRAQARNPITREKIEGAEADIVSGEQTSIESDRLPPIRRALAKSSLTENELRGDSIKRTLTNLERSDLDDLRDKQVRQLIQRVRNANEKDQDFIQELIRRRLIDDPSPTPSPRVSAAPLRSPSPEVTVRLVPSPTPSLNVSPSPLPSQSPTPSPLSSGSGTATSPTPTPSAPHIQSVSPKTAARGATVAVNGESFTTGRSTPQINAARLGVRSVQFATIDTSTLFVDIPTDIAPGTYDLTLVTVSGDILTLPQALTVQ